MLVTRRTRAVVLAVLLLMPAVAFPAAAAARSVKIDVTAHLKRTRNKDGVDYFHGSAEGTLPGRVDAALKIKLSGVTGTVIFNPGGGSITATVAGKPKDLSHLTGTMTVRGGTGRYANARGSADFSAVLARGRVWKATVNADGRLTY